MNTLKTALPGIILCALIALPCWLLGKAFPLVGAPVFGILAGMLIALVWKQSARKKFQNGIGYTAKKVLQYAVILLGFGLNLTQIAQVGARSLPIILATISTSLLVAYLMYRILHTSVNSATLIGVGSSICGGSAIAATAPVIKASDEDVAQAISVIFLFNVIAALIFPTLGTLLGLSNEGFALFAGTAINDTSSVTAAAAAWDGMHPGANTLDSATVVKLTRTLAIIPITLVLGIYYARKGSANTARKTNDTSVSEAPSAHTQAQTHVHIQQAQSADAHVQHATDEAPSTNAEHALGNFSLKRAFPLFILWFVVASLITTLASAAGVDTAVFSPLKTLSKYFICMAMCAIGLNTNLIKLVKSGGKPILMGFTCWVAIAAVSLGAQALLGIW